jgi:hypothetical protein
MGIRRKFRLYASQHEWVGNFFSLLAVFLIFGTVWLSLRFYRDIATWTSENMILHASMMAVALALDVLLILVFLSIGSDRADEEDERSFSTFKGRRSGGSPISAFRSWLHHMENVGKKHR